MEPGVARGCFQTRPKIIIKRLPLHAWNEEGFHQLLGDVCIFDRMEEATFSQEDTYLFACWAWMFTSVSKNEYLLIIS